LDLDLFTLLKNSNVLGKEAFDNTFMTRYIEENIKGINPKLL